MASRSPTSVRFDDEDREKIRDIKRLLDVDEDSEAVRRSVHIAHREVRHPITYRLKDEVVDWVGYLGVAAVIVFVGGATTPVLAVGEAVLFSISLVVVSGLMLAVYESWRLITAANEIGERVRAKLSEVAT